MCPRYEPERLKSVAAQSLRLRSAAPSTGSGLRLQRNARGRSIPHDDNVLVLNDGGPAGIGAAELFGECRERGAHLRDFERIDRVVLAAPDCVTFFVDGDGVTVI